MYHKSTILLFFIFLIVSCSNSKQKKSNEPYTLTASTGRYERIDNDRVLFVNVVLTNNTKDTLKYVSWTCPDNTEYTVKCDVLSHYHLIVCNATYPKELDLAPHKSIETEVELFFKSSFYGGAIKYQMVFELYNNPKKYFEMYISHHRMDEIEPKKFYSNIVETDIDPSNF